MNILRRDFLKYCAGSAAALGLEFSTFAKVLAARGASPAPTYPISTVYTTLQRTVIPATWPILPNAGTYAPIAPSDIESYIDTRSPTDPGNSYGVWYGNWNTAWGPAPSPGDPAPFLLPDMASTPNWTTSSGPDPSDATLLTFFTMSDIHICDKESPARAFYTSYLYPTPETTNPASGVSQPAGDISAYSGIVLSTTHVLDAAVQTINYLHQNVLPFDFGICLGDVCDNNQYNELRWFMDVMDGKWIVPSSGKHNGAGSIDYQMPYQAAGLDKSIKWYQAIGNHDQFWMGTTLTNSYTRKTLVGSKVLNLGPIVLQPPYYAKQDWNQIMRTRGYYMGVVDGSTPYGTIIDAGLQTTMPVPEVAADPRRHSLTVSAWMNEFFNTTSKPVGHGFTRQKVQAGFACYSFYPKANVPIKVIVLDDTDKTGSACGALDGKRFNWLVNQLEAGQKADQLMIVCAHIPVHPYTQKSLPIGGAPSYVSIWSDPDNSENVTELELLNTLHNYPNLILWVAGHAHRNTITPQPSPNVDPSNGWGFWEVETPSLRDFPQQFRCFQIVRNSEGNISVFVFSVDPAVAPPSPAFKSRGYAIAAQQIFGNPWRQGPCMALSDPTSSPNPNNPGSTDPSSNSVYNAELVIQASQLSSGLLSNISRFSG